MISSIVELQNATATGATPMKAGQELGKEEFLRMLMTQLSAQDPLNPMDSTEFTAQLSQFASLEQLTNLGSKMDNLITISGASNAANAVSLLGKEVRMDGNKIKGPQSVFYELSEPATSVKVEVRDEAGRVKHFQDGLSGSLGLNEVKLEGFEPGNYQVFVTAKTADGREITSRISTFEKVRGVNFNGNIPVMLMESGVEMAANQIVEIREPRGAK
jgi:flagellar basal-body rod modification protein FlgD